MSNASTSGGKSAVFFDVDGTLVRSTIVHYYAYFRRRRMPAWWRKLWYTAFLAKCLGYLLLDRIDRNRFNIVFYRNYKGLSVSDTLAMAKDCYEKIIKPRQFPDAVSCVENHASEGRDVVLVTGSIDFIMAPLAAELGVTHVIAAGLVEADGRFTGALDGPPIGGDVKAERIRTFAGANGIALDQSYAYGDSIADLPMLESVAFPHVVNPDKSLEAVTKERGWPVHRWTIASQSEGRS